MSWSYRCCLRCWTCPKASSLLSRFEKVALLKNRWWRGNPAAAPANEINSGFCWTRCAPVSWWKMRAQDQIDSDACTASQYQGALFPHTCRMKTTRLDLARCISSVKVAECSTGGHLRVCLLAGATTSSHTAAEVIENKTTTHRAAAKRKKISLSFQLISFWLWRRRNMNKGSKI